MDDVIVMDRSAADRRSLCGLLTAYQIASNAEFAVSAFGYGGTHAPWDGARLFFLDGSDAPALADAAAEIRSDRQAHRIALVLPRLEALRDCLTPNVLPVGLLVKPVALEPLTALLDVLRAMEREADGQAVFSCPQKGRVCRIPYGEILWFESRSKKTCLVTETQEFELYTSLDELEERLGAPFVRTHRSFLVNAERIREVNYEEMTVLLDDGSRALLSRTGKSRLRQVMEK